MRIQPRWYYRAASLLLSVALLLAAAPCLLLAQSDPNSRAVPRDDYFFSFRPYYDGDFKDAYEGFKSASKGGVRAGAVRWVDSICYHTMMGECAYQMGNRAEALDQYTAALQLLVTHRNWLSQVVFPPAINEASPASLASITWGKPARTSAIGAFPDKMTSQMGKVNQDDVLSKGGTLVAPQGYPLRVTEVVRCAALAISRRREIMGPTCEHDPFTNDILNALTGGGGAPPNHWSQSWVSVQLGMALASAGKKNEAVVALKNGLQVLNRYDHDLTPIALLELGKLAFAEKKYDVAAVMFREATFPAVAFGQHDVLEEAFRWGHVTHIVAGKAGVYPDLALALPWARTKSSKTLYASLFVCSAEGLCNLDKPGDAADLLVQAARVIGRRELAASNLGARFQYETARAAFAQGKVPQGNAALASCMTIQKNTSRRLYQISLADKLYTSRKITVDRIAETLYDDVLREPTADDWLTDPMETLTVASTPHLPPFEHWLEAAINRKQPDKASDIADRIRRHRFYTTVPTGGRLLALRWILEAPEEVLSDNAKLQRRDLLTKYPRLDALKKEAEKVRDALDALPRIPADAAAAKDQAALFAQLGTISTTQEALIADIALRREPSEFVFPPLITTKAVQQRLKDGQAMLAYLNTTRKVVGFAITKDSCKLWEVAPEDTIKARQDLAALFKAWGQQDKNFIVAAAELKKDAWKPIASRLLGSLTNGAKPEHFGDIQELIIVPDGLVWYVPFEALQLGAAGETKPLVSHCTIRYAPTMALALPTGLKMPRTAQSLIVAGKMFPKEAETAAADEAAALAKALSGGQIAPKELTAPGNLFGAFIERLIVLDDFDDLERGPYDWSPLRIDQGKPGSALANWAFLPWRGPQQVVLPGFHTAAENGLKKGGAAGDEIFLSVMGLMASGSRTVMISRWRTGGQTAYDLTREFAQELPHTSAANAWQRAVQMVGAAPLDVTREPRVRAAADEMLSADHPFFWAGYLLVDTGEETAP